MLFQRLKSYYDEHSYKDELDMYIKEASSNLHDYDAEVLDSSGDETSEDDEADEVSLSLRDAGRIQFFTSIASVSLNESEDEFVVPPVEVPRKYRRQDRQGGVLVAGHYVLFTNWAFKRQMLHMGRLTPHPEHNEAQVHALNSATAVRSFAGKIVEL